MLPTTATLHIGRKAIGGVNSIGPDVIERKPNGYSSAVAAGYFVIDFSDGAKMERLAPARARYTTFRLAIRNASFGAKYTFRGKIIGINRKKRTAKVAVQPGSIVTNPNRSEVAASATTATPAPSQRTPPR